MKRGHIALIVLAIVLLILMSYSLLKDKIQFSPSSETNVKISLKNSPPTIESIAPIPNVDLIPSSTKAVSVVFTARDQNGRNDLDDSTALVSFSKSGEITRNSANCAGTNLDPKQKTYTCIVNLEYFDGSGSWTATASIQDKPGVQAQSTDTFTVNLLRDISISSSTISFPDVVQGEVNIIPLSPITITNNGNAQVPSSALQITAHDLLGEITSSEKIPAANFRTSGLADACASGDLLSNGISTAISSAALPKGELGSNTGDLYYCLTLVPDDISTQAYSTTATGGTPWTITLN